MFGQEPGIGQQRSSTNARVALGSNVVATVHPIASRAAIDVYRQGGNAIDAAVAAALCLGVVDGHNSGIGGGSLILIRTKLGEVHAIDGREAAPSASTPSLYIKDGKPNVELSQTGPLAVAVPSQVAALYLAHSKLGALAWSACFEPAIAAAIEGYAVGQATQNAIQSEQIDLARFEASRSALLKSNGQPLAVGDLLRQPDLGKTLREIAKNGPDWFYQGPFASQCAKHLQSLGGVLSQDDMSNYKAIERKCIESNYRSYKILGFPTPSSGGTHIAQMLNMLQHFDVASIYRDSPTKFFHLLAECMKRAFADRAHWLGDSDFVKVPSFLTEPNYAADLAKQIDLEKASIVSSYGNPFGSDDSKKHTTHLTTADALGNWVALTSTVNTTWGSKVMVPGTGVMLNNQMDDFSISPGVPNAFGLVGSEANAVAPNKRPLSSMSPSIVLSDDGTPFMTCGAAGGPKIINATFQNIVRCIDLEQPIDMAIASARVHHQWRPDLLCCESKLGGIREKISVGSANESEPKDEIALRLQSMGHSIKMFSSLAIAQGIQSTPQGLMAASDPRTDSSALSQ